MRKVLITSLLIIIAFLGKAQTVEFRAFAPSVVEKGEQFRIQYTINSDAEDLKVDFNNSVKILMGPSVSTSTSTQYSNGKISSKKEKTYTYIAVLNNIGVFRINPASIKAKGRKYESNSLNIKVVKGKPKSKAKSVRGVTGNNLFVRVEVDKKSLFIGESAVVSFKFYSQVAVSRVGAYKFPSMNGFLSKDIEIPQNINLNREEINGEIYNVGVLRKMVIFPQHTGKIVIDPFKIDFYVRKQPSADDFFDDFFGNYQDVKVHRISKPISINVKELPKVNQPSDFYGTVGRFAIRTSISRDSVKANDAVTLRVKLIGNGNLKLIEPLKIDFPADFEVYEPKTVQNIQQTSTGSKGNISFEYVFVPRSEGEFTIPSSRFVYYDLFKKKYVVLKTKSFKLKVIKGKRINTDNNVVASFVKEDVKLIGKDIRYINTAKTRLFKKNNFYINYIWYLLALLIFITSIYSLLLSRTRKNNSDIGRVKNKRASKLARKRLKLANEQIKIGNKERFYEEILKAILGFTSDKMLIAQSELSRDNVSDILTKNGVEESLINEYLELIDMCEFARYAPASSDSKLDVVYERVRKLLIKLS